MWRIDIKGKAYVLVKDRIVFFNDNFTNGRITTKLLSEPDAEMVVMRATVIPDIEQPGRIFIGHSQAKWGQGMVNTTAAMENCETSAVGRALAMMGIGVIDSIASVDEINKATSNKEEYAAEDSATCPIHKAKMIHYENEKGEWWAHKLESGDYCNGRKTAYNKAKK